VWPSSLHAYFLIYGAALFFGAVLKFTFRGVIALLIGMGITIYSVLVWKDIVMANTVAFISSIFAIYYFGAKDW
jgi:hypothetical protein